MVYFESITWYQIIFDYTCDWNIFTNREYTCISFFIVAATLCGPWPLQGLSEGFVIANISGVGPLVQCSNSNWWNISGVGPLVQCSNSNLEDQGQLFEWLLHYDLSCEEALPRAYAPASLALRVIMAIKSTLRGKAVVIQKGKNVVVSYTCIYGLFNDDSSSWHYLTSESRLINDRWNRGHMEWCLCGLCRGTKLMLTARA
jgi:hypothetical protein